MAIGLLSFLVLPIVLMVMSSFQIEQSWSFENYLSTIRGEYLRAFITTLEISLVTAIVGGVPGVRPGKVVVLGGGVVITEAILRFCP